MSIKKTDTSGTYISQKWIYKLKNSLVLYQMFSEMSKMGGSERKDGLWMIPINGLSSTQKCLIGNGTPMPMLWDYLYIVY